MVILPPQPTSFSINLVVTQTTIRGFRHSFFPIFTLPSGGKEYPYGIQIALMADLHTNASIYADNIIVVVSPVNQYMASGSSISNLD